jgi:capsular exopolysaccharide synthesis family protein
MPAHLVPSDPTNGVTVMPPGGAAWAQPAPQAPASGAISEQLSRIWAALRRYKWLILAVLAIGSSAGYALTRFVSPKFTVGGSVVIARAPGGQGPIAAPGLVSDANSWADLAKSYLVLDQVVQRLGLHVTPDVAADTVLVSDLLPSNALRTGRYELRIDAAGTGYSLLAKPERSGGEMAVVETGVLGDSIGRAVGFRWQPPAGRFRPGRAVGFTVVTPRDAAVALQSDLVIGGIGQNSSMLRLQMSGTNPALLSAQMNTLLQVFVSEATRLKRDHLTAARATIEDQLARSEQRLRTAENSLESFKVNAITLPSENTVVAAGAQMSLNPVFSKFFTDNVQAKAIQRDRQALEGLFAAAQQSDGRLSIQGLKALPPIAQPSPLLNEINNLEIKQALLRQLQQRFTDEFLPVATLKEEIRVLETETIPLLAKQSLDQLSIQEADLKKSIEGQAAELKRIPERTIEEASRARDVFIADKIYTDLETRYATAQLAELSAIADIQIFDTATVPSRPSSDTKAGFFLVSILASLGLGIGAAILLDRLDRRFRYPEQATRELGLDIMSGIPTIRNPRNASARLQEASQLVESFRSLSLTVRSAFDGLGPAVLTVSSPGPGDGKSFVSANLAMALADGGYRTALIDGDIRRGALHSVFAPLTQTPGLTDYLAGDAILSEVLRPTSHPGLFLVPCGRRRRNGPELLAGEGMVNLMRELRQQFDAVICDSAPLGAGIDPFALGVATGAMLIVLRAGETDRKLAQAKLEVLDRMPVRVLGTVLNDIGENPQFRYYYYLEGYGALENSVTEENALIGSGGGRAP